MPKPPKLPSLPGIVAWKDLQAEWKQSPAQMFFVAVRWVDAAHHPEGSVGSIEVVTCGILKHIDRAKVAVSMDVFGDGEHQETSTVLRRNVRHLVLFGALPAFHEKESPSA